MSRTIATVKRPDAHDYDADPATGGQYCRCGLPRRNSVHNQQDIDKTRAQRAAANEQVAAAQEAHQRRTGDR